MKRVNINVALCKEYDFKTQSVDGFLHEVVENNNKAEVTIFTIVSGIEDDCDTFKYDFYLKFVDGENKKQIGAVSYLFTMTGYDLHINNNEQDGYEQSSYKNTYCEISALKKEISFLGKGYYELIVYEFMEELAEEKSAIERYKKLSSDNFPVTTYSFKVV